MYERIVAGTDLSKTARVATDRAANLAERLGAELYLVHAGRDPGQSLKELAKEYGVEAIVEEGNPAEVLIDKSEELKADLLVVGSVGMSGAKRFLLGSVPNKVSHHAPSDLLVVKTDPPPHDFGDYQKLMVGTDGSPTAMRALDAACVLAKALSIQPVVVCVYEPLTEHEKEVLRADPNDAIAQWSADRSIRDTPEEFRWRIAGAKQAEDVLDRAADHATKCGVEAETRAVEGNPAEVLISIAEKENFDLIVVGSVGMRGPKRFALGNVPHRISHHAPTDVLILKTS
jgi:nucleotide-binding universal stress UspA family protein